MESEISVRSKFQSNTEDVVQWLPDGSPSRLVYNAFEEKFGSDDFLVVTWDDCTVDDPRLEYLCDRVIELDSGDYIQSVVNGADIIDRLREEGGLQKKYVLKRFKGIFFGFDDSAQTLVLVELSKKGSADRKGSLELVEAAIGETPDLALEQITFGGYPYVGINLDNQLKNSILYFLLPSVLCATVISVFCLRNAYLSLIVFFSACSAGLCSVAIVPMLGFKFSGLMSIIPALVYILTTSGSIHLVHYSLDAIGDPKKLIAIGWRPCCISALTTAIGMLSLGRSSFPAIRSFGFFCATGAGFALIFQMVIVPWLLHRFGESGQRALAKQSTSHQLWDRASGQIARSRLSRLTARVDVGKLFDADSAIIASLTNLEERMGPIDQAEFLIEFQDVDLYQQRLDSERDRLAESRFLSVVSNAETWRISLRYPFTEETNVEKLEELVMDTASHSLDTQIEKEEFAAISSRIQLTYTGKNHLFHSAQTTLLADFYRNFLLAFIIITPVLIVVLRSFWLGLLAMLPNLFPIVVLFGGLGWFNLPVDLAIAMTASVALGIAVDDTTHFLIRFREFGGSAANVLGPVRQAICQCGPAMLHTTAIGSAGLLVYAWSEMVVVKHFSLAITGMLVLALVADVFMLPALLLLHTKPEKKP